MDYTNNGEYDKGYVDGGKDVISEQPVRDLDFYSASYRLGYFRGRTETQTTIDSAKKRSK